MIDVKYWMIDIVLVGVAAEFAVLAWLAARHGMQHLVLPLFLFLASGTALMVALRFSLAPDQHALIPLALFSALFLHAACIAVGYRRFHGDRTARSQSAMPH